MKFLAIGPISVARLLRTRRYERGMVKRYERGMVKKVDQHEREVEVVPV